MSNEAKITMDEARDLVSNQMLWPLVRDFLWDFVPQVHRSWLEGLEVGKVEGLMDEKMLAGVSSSQTFKRFVLEQLGIEPCFYSFPRNDWSRLLLLDGSTLELIAKWIGALACSDELRRVTDGAAVRELKASLSGVYPEVFGYTMYFKGVDFQRRDEMQKGIEGIASIGFYVLLSLLADVPSSLVARLKFKLPKKLSDSATLRFKVQTCDKVVAKLLKLKFPEAHKLCC